MTEIEIKARIDNPDETEKKIAAFAAFSCETRKRDTYWILENPAVKVRVRDEGGSITVTYKKKELRGEMEVNDEREFGITDRSAFEMLLADAGFAAASHKEKKTKRWARTLSRGTVSEIGIELSLVERLGWYLELEALSEAPGEAEVEMIREALMETLKLCGVGADAIETRYYTEMLAEIDSRT